MVTIAHISLTGASQTFDFLVLTVSWLIVRAHIRKSSTAATPTIVHMYQYFGYFALFNFFMAVPFLSLTFQPSSFPTFMAWGYVIANIFLLISLMHISLMTIKLLPRFADKDKLIRGIWIGIVTIMTILNAIVIGVQHQPTYDTASRVAHYAIPTWMGATLGMISFLAYLPAIGVLVYSLIHQSREQRVRSSLLVIGFVIIMFVGPLHAVASNWRVFLFADILNMVSLAFLTSGVLFRIKPQVASVPPKSTPQPLPPSNTI